MYIILIFNQIEKFLQRIASQKKGGGCNIYRNCQIDYDIVEKSLGLPQNILTLVKQIKEKRIKFVHANNGIVHIADEVDYESVKKNYGDIVKYANSIGIPLINQPPFY
jgi:hypothetical protein